MRAVIIAAVIVIAVMLAGMCGLEVALTALAASALLAVIPTLIWERARRARRA